MNLKTVSTKGEGYFCIIILMQDSESNDLPYAKKQLKRKHYGSEEYKNRFIREVAILAQLQECPNIIDLIDSGHDKSKKSLWYLMSYAECNLHTYMALLHE